LSQNREKEQKSKSILLFEALGIVNCTFKKQTKMKKLLFFAMIASSLYACQSETKPAFDLAKAKTEIEAANDAIGEIMAKGDSVAMAAAYSTDGSVMLDNMPSVKGKDQLATVWGGYFRAGLSKIDLTTLEVWGDENYITEEGVFEIKTKDDVQIDKGKYIVLWKKEDGKWKLHRDLSNSDLPLATK
jgi:ketosteroid isomerase-like protein